jgi:aspartyl-tRNA(Asn)/glutamyl-tRNA(Gln) amidotransferase subunit C
MDLEIVRNVAKVARLRLTEEELVAFAQDMSEILDFFALLDEAPDIGAYGFNPVEVADVLREDEADVDIPPEELLRDMNTYQEWIRGPRLV